jgi:hypothetical protein
MYQFLLFPRLTMLMAFPIRLFDAETIINSSIKDDSRHMRISFCVTTNSSSN